MSKGLFVAIAGPSGSGKGTVIRQIKELFPNAKYVLSQTTRQIRPGEKAGEVYEFVTKEEFEKNIKEDKFLEYALVHKKEYYGVLKAPVIKDLDEGFLVVREVDIQGVESISKVLPPEDLLTIFIYPDNIEILKQRILKRGKLPEEEIDRRMQSAENEMKHMDNFDFKVPNFENRLEECTERVSEIIKQRLIGKNIK